MPSGVCGKLDLCMEMGHLQRFFCTLVMVFWGSMAMAQSGGLHAALLDARPYAWTDEKGQPQGLYPDIVAAVFREAGQEVRITVVPFARAAALVVHGGADLTLMFEVAQTEGKVQRAAVVFYTQQVVQLRPGLSLAPQSKLAGLTIGRMIGGCKEMGTGASERMNFHDLASQESGVRMLAMGRIDGFCTANEALEDVLARTDLGPQFVRAQRRVLDTRPVWLMLNAAVPQSQRIALVAALKRVQKSGEMARIFVRHLGNAYELALPKP